MSKKKLHRHVRIGGTFLGVSTRADGRTRANFLVNPATGQDRSVVRVARRALGAVTECPTCGGRGKPGLSCPDDWHRG